MPWTAAPFHPIARGPAGPEMLAMILETKLPLNRQSETYAREGIPLDTSPLADWIGACTATLSPLVALIEAHVLAAGRLHGDDTTVPVLAKGKTVTGRLWTYVRDDRPFAGPAPPAAMFFYSSNRTGDVPSQISDETFAAVAGRFGEQGLNIEDHGDQAVVAQCRRQIAPGMQVLGFYRAGHCSPATNRC